MLHAVIGRAEALPLAVRRKYARLLMLAGGLMVTAIVGALAVWFLVWSHVPDLSVNGAMAKAGVYESWKRGEVIVLIRHAERCDRSKAPCLGAPEGITVNGSQAAVQVGKGLKTLGLAQTDIFASPLLRTQQTADWIVGHSVATQDWLKLCGKGFASDVLEHKTPNRNLVLITHSGCIDQFERQQNVPGGERSFAYAQALFVSVSDKGQPRILGSISADEWQKVEQQVRN
ncbi:histidine phosphatase family protein [Pseudomonas laurentiana]|nr:histidine phosphatase family protein [Pseudomonas laurentiana]